MRGMYELTDTEKKNLYRAVVNAGKTGQDYKKVAQDFDVPQHVVSGVAGRLRRAGVAVPKKSLSSILTPDFLTELNQLLAA